MWRSASSSTSSASVHQAPRRNALSRNKETKRESSAPFTQLYAKSNRSQEQADSGSPRRLDHSIVSVIISAAFSLTLLYICFPFRVANRSETASMTPTLSSAAADDKLFRRHKAAASADAALLLEPQDATMP
ncbi:hypothetical protein AAVH_20550 [Aphelenchoides avenae]|nr:hypothetical protein AAVH_20550 [Aphelenchus avenae]